MKRHSPSRVVTGKSNSHGWHRVLHNREELNIAEVVVTLLIESVQHQVVGLYVLTVVAGAHL